MIRRFSDADAADIRRLRAHGHTFSELARIYKTAKSTIENIVYQTGAYRPTAS